MNRSSFGGSPFTPRGSPYTPRGRGGSGGSGGFRGRAARFSPLVGQSPSPAGRVPDFTPSPRGGRGGRGGWGSPRGGGGTGWGTPRGRGFGSPRGRGGRGGGGGGGLCFDDTFVRFATENPWSDLERQKGLSSALGPLNSGGGGPRHQSTPQGDSPAASPAQNQQQSLPVPDDDDSFV